MRELREPLVYAVLVIAIGIVAYTTWKREEPLGVGETVLFELEATPATVHYKDDVADTTLTVTPRSGEEDEISVWIEFVSNVKKRKKVEPAEPPTSSPASSAAPAEGVDAGTDDSDVSVAVESDVAGDGDAAGTAPVEDGGEATAGKGADSGQRNGDDAVTKVEADAGAKADKPEIEYETVERKYAFPGNDNAEQLVKDMKRFTVKRIFTEVPPELSERMGLDEEERGTLTITVGNDKKVFILGAKAYGSSDTYAKGPDGKLVLLSKDLVTSLRNARYRLRETRVLPLDKEAYDGVRIEPSGRGAVDGSAKDDGDERTWHKKGSTDADPSVSSIVEKAIGLRVQRAAPTSDELVGQPEVVGRVTFTRKGKPVASLVLARGSDDRGEVWLAQSETTREMVRVSPQVASDLALELVGVDVDGSAGDDTSPAVTP